MSNTLISPETINTLRELGSATIYEAQGAKGALDGGLKPIDPGMRVAGPVITVDTCPADNLMLHYALLKAKAGDVLVVDAKGFLEAGPWGDVLTQQALQIGLAGLVINGAVRDAQTIIEMGFPVFCRGLSIKGTSKQHCGQFNSPVVLSCVEINPGDIIVGDRDGLVVVARTEVEDTLRKSLAREQKEAGFREQIKRGATTVELLGLGEVLRQFNLS
jgi:4-hydroxy-4-methyl-2-oxoglutarate aldolase